MSTVTVTSANGIGPYTALWESSMDGYSGPDAISQSGAFGSVDTTVVNGVTLVAVGRVTVEGTPHFFMQLEPGANTNFFTTVTSSGPASATYQRVNAQVYAQGVDVLGLGLSNSEPGPSLWWPSAVTDFVNGQNTVLDFGAPVSTLPTIVQATPTFTNGGVHLAWTPTAGTGTYAGAFTSFSIFRNGLVVATVAASIESFVDFPPQDVNTYEIQGAYDNPAASPPIISNDETTQGILPGSAWNCDCEAVSPYDTLLNLRKRMLIRLGYPNQVTTPPPGMASLIDEFLRSAQREIYRQLVRASRRTERFYRWTMVPGERYYGLDDNEDACTVKLDPEKVTWVGFEDLNQAWYRLDDGIPPEYYTRANINFGWPTRFEIRSCIEIFPAPQAPYTLWIKGDFGLAPLVGDTDRSTIDDEAVFLLALGNAKADRGQKDAQLVLTQAGNYIKGLVAGAHGTKRYVPRSQSENPLTPPRFLPLGNEQA